MPNKYSTVITTVGASMIADCLLNGKKLNITQAAAGDGDGTYYVPTADQNSLKNERWRGEIAAVGINTVNPNMFDVKVIIADDTETFTVREVGLFDGEGNLIAICNTPDTEKVNSSAGISGKLTILMHIVVADSSMLTFTINPSLNTIGYDEVTGLIAAHNSDADAHPGTFASKPIIFDDVHISITDWTSVAEKGGYMQTVTIEGVLETDVPDVDVLLGDDLNANELFKEAWARVDRVKTAKNSITLYAPTCPTSNFTIRLKVVR